MNFPDFKEGSMFQFSGDSTVVQRNLFTQPGGFGKPNLQLCGLLTFSITLPKAASQEERFNLSSKHQFSGVQITASFNRELNRPKQAEWEGWIPK